MVYRYTRRPVVTNELVQTTVKISTGDCGSTGLIPLTVRSGKESDSLVGRWYKDEHTGCLTQMTYDRLPDYFGKVVSFRSSMSCLVPDNGVCSICSGREAGIIQGQSIPNTWRDNQGMTYEERTAAIQQNHVSRHHRKPKHSGVFPQAPQL